MTIAHPLFRLPIFLMGMLGGLQVLRAHNRKEIFNDPDLSKNILHTLLPWGCCTSPCCSEKIQGVNGDNKTHETSSTQIWKRRVDFIAFVYVGFLTALITINVTLHMKYDDEGKSM